MNPEALYRYDICMSIYMYVYIYIYTYIWVHKHIPMYEPQSTAHIRSTPRPKLDLGCMYVRMHVYIHIGTQTQTYV